MAGVMESSKRLGINAGEYLADAPPSGQRDHLRGALADAGRLEAPTLGRTSFFTARSGRSSPRSAESRGDYRRRRPPGLVRRLLSNAAKRISR